MAHPESSAASVRCPTTTETTPANGAERQLRAMMRMNDHQHEGLE
jgi:hypothetical protein